MVTSALLLSACSDGFPPPFEPAGPVITPFVGHWVAEPEVFSGGDHALTKEFSFTREGRFEYVQRHLMGCSAAGDALECDTLVGTRKVSGTFALEGDRCEFSVVSTDFTSTVPFMDDCSFELTAAGLLFRFLGPVAPGGVERREQLYRRGSWSVDG